MPDAKLFIWKNNNVATYYVIKVNESDEYSGNLELTDVNGTTPIGWNNNYSLLTGDLTTFIDRFIKNKQSYRNGTFSEMPINTTGGKRRRRTTKKARKTRRRSKIMI
jgi:hypothetical protein